MPRTRKRKVPIVPHATTAASKPQVTRSVIREFHVLLKRQAYLKKKPAQDAEAQLELFRIGRRIEELGGLERYQHMSAVGQNEDRGGGSHRLFISWLRELGCNERRVAGDKLRLLEVGALKHDNYQTCSSWIEVLPIDLHSRHPAIEEQDFLLLDPGENEGKWGAVSLSLVLNFVPDARDRGRMLRLAHRIIAPDGYLFLALPLPCLYNSRYLTFDRFKELMEAIGFIQVREKWKEGGKMVYYLYRRGQAKSVPLRVFGKKEALRSGNRNNFAVLLDE